ncbi:MAG TPA: ATPase, T2SS/T4P/T4SS family [Bacillota bacterium]|nr:ATPase, T2SS/T4P/T4SS family [Bacillota bacterium]
MAAKDGLMGRLLGASAKFTDKQVAETLAMLVEYGLEHGSSDIHLEPHERFVLVRYRIDGTLRGIHKLPKAAQGSVLAQLKQLAGLDTQETAAPQEGHYEVTVGDRKVDVRLSTMPVFGGEKAVLHLSIERGKPLNLAALGLWGTNLSAVQTVLTHPHGLLIVAGPRHSGSSTTLFSLLDALNNPLVSIATVEMHPKHRLPGLNQTYLAGNALSVHDGLQSALKQDPNVVMLSEMPDSATIHMAVHAATTGHLILAGLHAETGASALLRIRAAGVEPFVLVTALRAVIAQRLVRTLCPDCRVRYMLSRDEQKELARNFAITSATAYKRVHELERSVAPAVFGDVKQLSSTASSITHLWRASDNGCETCDHTGYTGRTAIVEVLQNTPALQKALLGGEIASAAALQAAALKDGFIPMALDGLVKALRGQTTISEVLHAIAPLA